MKKKIAYFVALYPIIFSVIFSGCNIPKNQPVLPTVEPVLTLSTEAEPTTTATPDPDRTIFIPGVDQRLNQMIDSSLQRIASVTHQIQTVEAFRDDLADPSLQTVVFGSVPEHLSETANRYPGVTFIVLSETDLSAPNIWSIQYNPASELFLAAYALSIGTYDWRIAGILPTDGSLGTSMVDIFSGGAQLYCGTCLSKLQPNVNFPIVISYPTSAEGVSWTDAIDEAQKKTVYSYFIPVELTDADVWLKIASYDIRIISSADMPPGFEEKWLATLRLDVGQTITSILERASQGEHGVHLAADLVIRNGQYNGQFNAGKTKAVQEVYDRIVSGLLSPYRPNPDALILSQ